MAPQPMLADQSEMVVNSHWLVDSHPGSLLGGPSHHGFETLAHPWSQQEGAGGFAHEPLDLGGVSFLLRAMCRERAQLLIGIGRRPGGQRRLEQPLHDEIGKTSIGRGGSTGAAL